MAWKGVQGELIYNALQLFSYYKFLEGNFCPTEMEASTSSFPEGLLSSISYTYVCVILLLQIYICDSLYLFIYIFDSNNTWNIQVLKCYLLLLFILLTYF